MFVYIYSLVNYIFPGRLVSLRWKTEQYRDRFSSCRYWNSYRLGSRCKGHFRWRVSGADPSKNTTNINSSLSSSDDHFHRDTRLFLFFSPNMSLEFPYWRWRRWVTIKGIVHTLPPGYRDPGVVRSWTGHRRRFVDTENRVRKESRRHVVVFSSVRTVRPSLSGPPLFGGKGWGTYPIGTPYGMCQ